MKIYLVRDDDLDGVGTEIITRVGYENYDIEVITATYKDVNEKVINLIERVRDEDCIVLIADLSVNKEVADLIENNSPEKFLLLDHHKTSLWLNEYKWAIINEKICGTMMVFDYILFKALSFNDKELLHKLGQYLQFIEIVNDYDMWIHNYPESKGHNQLYYLIGSESYVKRVLSNPSIKFTDEELTLLKVENARKQRYFEKVSKTVVGRSEYGIVFAEEFTSELGHYILDTTDFNIVVLINLKDRKVSLRSKPNVDCSKIAKTYGGGGHPQASGFELDDNKINQIINIILH